jgi:ketosteroid isomerase-like protein
MLRYLTAAVIACIPLTSMDAQTKGVPQASPTTQTFIDLENKWNDVLVKKDATALGAMLADDYVVTDEFGHVHDKAAQLARLKSGQRNFQTMKLSDLRVHMFGDVVVVTGVNTVTGTTDGKSTPSKLAFTDTFARQNGTWRAIATHVSEVK